MFALILIGSPKLRNFLEKDSNLANILDCMIPTDLKEKLRHIWQDIYKGFGTFEDFLVSSLLDKFLADQTAAYVAIHPNPCPEQCTFWEQHYDRIQQAAHTHAVKETITFLESLCDQTPGLPSDQKVLTQRLELVGLVNDLCRQILHIHDESKRSDLELAQNAKEFVTFDNAAAEASAASASACD